MTINEIIEKVKEICNENNVAHHYLFGSYAKGINWMGVIMFCGSNAP